MASKKVKALKKEIKARKGKISEQEKKLKQAKKALKKAQFHCTGGGISAASIQANRTGRPCQYPFQ